MRCCVYGSARPPPVDLPDLGDVELHQIAVQRAVADMRIVRRKGKEPRCITTWHVIESLYGSRWCDS